MLKNLRLGGEFVAAVVTKKGADLLTQASRHLRTQLSPLLQIKWCGRGQAAQSQRSLEEIQVAVDEMRNLRDNRLLSTVDASDLILEMLRGASPPPARR